MRRPERAFQVEPLEKAKTWGRNLPDVLPHCVKYFLGNINICFLMTKPFQRGNWQPTQQSSYWSLWLIKEFIAFTYRSMGEWPLIEARMIQRQLATLKIPPQPGWQLKKTTILECNMTDWQTGGSFNQRAQHDWQTGDLTSQRLFCASPSHWSVPGNFPPSMVGFGFSILRVRGLGLLRILAFPNKKSVHFLGLTDLPSLSWAEKINTVTQHYWPAEDTPRMAKSLPLRRYSILLSNTSYYLNTKIAACTRLNFF